MTKASIFPHGTLLQQLYAIRPYRRGPGGIESLSSLITRLASHHNCTPYSLFSMVIVPHRERLSRHWKRIRWGESHLINCYGMVAAKIVSIVSDCTGRADIPNTTFVGLEELCDKRGKHFLHKVRPWCPECYIEARERDISAWDALYTYPRTTKVCVWHETPLRFACPECQRGQRFIPKFPLLDYCEHCGSNLAVPTLATELSKDELNNQLWMARAGLDIIEALCTSRPLSSSHFFANVRNLMETHFRGLEQPFSRRLSLAGSSPKNWLKRGSSPTWASLVELGYRLDIPPSHLGSPELVLTDPAYWRSCPLPSLDRPHIRPSPTKLREINNALKERLDIKEITSLAELESIPQIAKRLGVSPSTIKRHFPDQHSQLVQQRIRLLKSLRKLREREKEIRLSEAVAATMANRQSLTIRNLKKTGKIKVSDIVASINS